MTTPQSYGPPTLNDPAWPSHWAQRAHELISELNALPGVRASVAIDIHYAHLGLESAALIMAFEGHLHQLRSQGGDEA